MGKLTTAYNPDVRPPETYEVVDWIVATLAATPSVASRIVHGAIHANEAPAALPAPSGTPWTRIIVREPVTGGRPLSPSLSVFAPFEVVVQGAVADVVEWNPYMVLSAMIADCYQALVGRRPTLTYSRALGYIEAPASAMRPVYLPDFDGYQSVQVFRLLLGPIPPSS